MSADAELIVLVEGREVGLDRLLQRTEDGLRKTDAAAERTREKLGAGLAQGANQGRDAILAMQSAVASNQARTGDYEGAIQRLQSALEQQNLTTRQTLGVEGQLIQLRAQAARAAQTEQAAYAQLQQTLARNEAATGNYREAINRLQTLQRQSGLSAQQVAGVERQLIGVRQQAISAIERERQAATQLNAANNNLANGFAGLRNIMGAAGLALSAQSIFQIGVSAMQTANSLEKTQATVLALSGSQDRYNQVLRIAQQEQNLFGGSLESNLRSLGSLVNLSNRSGVELERLNNIMRRLATVDAAQGPEGAAYALKEFLSGDNAAAAKSLIDRFELSPTLKDIASSGASAAEKIAALDAELNRLGITNEVLTNSANTTAATYDRAGAAVDRLTTAFGSLLARGLEPAARGFTLVTDAITTYVTASQQAADLGQRAFTGAQNYEDYATRIRMVNEQLAAGGVQTLPALTQAQYAYAQSLIATGTAAQQAFTQAQSINTLVQQLDLMQAGMQKAGSEMLPVLEEARGKIEEIALISPASTDSVLGLANAWTEGALSGPAFIKALDDILKHEQMLIEMGSISNDMESRRVQGLAAVGAAAAVTGQQYQINSSALAENTQRTLENQLQSQQLAALQADLANIAGAVYSGHITAGQGAEILAGKYRIAAQEAANLITLQNQIASAGGGAKFGTSGPVAASGFGQLANADQVKKIQARSRAIRAALDDEALATGNAAQKRAIYNRRLAEARDRYGELSPEYIKARSALKSYDQQQERSAAGGRGRGGGGGAGRTKVSAAQKLASDLGEVQIKANQQYEDAELAHQKKLLDIAVDFAERRLEAEDRYQQALLEGRADFYENLANIKDQSVAKAASEQYEQAAAEAQRIAGEKGADVAERYLAEQEKIIQARAKRAERMRELEQMANEGKDARGEAVDEDARAAAASELEYLKGVEELRRQAEERRLASAREGRKSLAAEEQAALDEENTRYEEAQGKIADTADRTADKKVRASQRSQKETAAENRLLDEQARLYERIAGKSPAAGQPRVPSTPAPPTPPATPAGTNAAAPAAPASAQTPTSDQLIQAVADLAGQVATLASTVDRRLNDLGEKVGAVEAATRRGADKVASAVSSRSGPS